MGNRIASIKSAKALSYADAFRAQAPDVEPFDCPVRITLTIFYASRRPDLDESLILDLLQGIAYVNDRQVREKHVFWGLDPERPRCHIRVEADPALDRAGGGRRDKGKRTAQG